MAYVIAGYGVVIGGLGAYAAHVLRRRRSLAAALRRSAVADQRSAAS